MPSESIVVKVVDKEIIKVKVNQGIQGFPGIPGENGTVILSGTGNPPDPTGLEDGTLYIKYI